MTAEPIRRYDDAGYRPPTRSTSAARGGTATRPTRPARPKPDTTRDDTTAVPSQRRAPEPAGTRRRAAPPVPVAAPRAPFVVLVLALVAAGIVGLLVLNTAINSSSLTLSRMRTQQANLDGQEQEYRRELADLESPGSLQAAATRMGLVPAGTTAYIRLPDGKVIGVPQPAPAASDPGSR